MGPEAAHQLFVGAPELETGDLGCRRPAETGGQLGSVEQPADGVGQGRVVLGRHQQAVLAVAQHLGDAGGAGRHHRRAAGHRLEQHVGDAVAVAVREHPAGQGEDRGPPVELRQLLLRAEAPDVHPLAEVQLVDQRRQLGLEGSLAVDLAAHPSAVGGQPGAGADQQVEALLARQPADRQDQRRLAPVAGGPEELGIEAVRHPHDLVRQPLARQPPQGGCAVTVTGHREPGAPQAAAQPGGGRRVEVLGMTGEGVADAAQLGHQMSHPQRFGAVVSVEMADAAAAGLGRHPARPDKAPQALGEAAPPLPVGPAEGGQRRPRQLLARHRAPRPRPPQGHRQVGAGERRQSHGARPGGIQQRAADVGGRRMDHRALGPLEGEQHQRHAQGLDRPHLVEDEGLGDHRERLEQVADGAAPPPLVRSLARLHQRLAPRLLRSRRRCRAPPGCR